MNMRLQEILQKMKALEQDLAEEIHRNEAAFLYKIHGSKVVFEEGTHALHAPFAMPVGAFLREASLFNILSAPLIWFCLLPILSLDIVISIYQAICFPIYGIPKVRRDHYIVMDRSRVNYLNIIEKINCAYCSYFNGVIAFIQEVAGRTEQYWCPIKHARRISSIHSRYVKFFEYGDAAGYREHMERLRRDFDDIEDSSAGQ